MTTNPEAQEKLYEQIHSVLGDRTEPTPEDLSNMPYLKGCMLESFRYINILCMACAYTFTFRIGCFQQHIIPRLLPEDTTLIGNHIPAEVYS